MRPVHCSRKLVALVAIALCTSVLGAVPASATPTWSVAPSASPAFPHDAPDPDVLRVGSRYYGYTTGTTWGNHIGVLTSDDPATGWSTVGSALPAVPSWQQVDTQTSPGVFFWAGRYVMFYNAIPAAGGPYCLSVATSSSPTGPFVDSTSGSIECQTTLGGSIDPSPFIDHGSPYLYWKNNDGSSAAVSSVWVAPLSADGLQLAGAPQLVMSKDSVNHPWETTVDDPQMVLVNGAYYLFFTGGDYLSSDYAVGYAICSTYLGPCTQPQAGPILSSYGSAAGPGGGTVFTDTAGRFWLSYAAWAPGCTNYGCQGERRLFTAPMRAPGTWSGWDPLGGVLAGDPATTSWSTNRLDVVVRGTDNQVWHKWWAGTGWSGWEPLGGVLAGDPAAASWSANRLDVFAKATDGQLQHKWWAGTGWSGWEPLGGGLGGDPAATSWAASRLDVLVRGTDNQLWHQDFE